MSCGYPALPLLQTSATCRCYPTLEGLPGCLASGMGRELTRSGSISPLGETGGSGAELWKRSSPKAVRILHSEGLGGIWRLAMVEILPPPPIRTALWVS